MTEKLSASLRSHNKEVFNLTPGIISEFCDINHDPHADGGKFRVLIVGGDDPNKFEDEGLDIATKAVAELKDKSVCLVYVGAGKDSKKKFAKKFHDCGIAKSQLTIKSQLPNSKEGWAKLFCEVDLAIMPSSEKQFGMEALLALSAGLPVLVHGDSGFGEALSEVEFGDSAIVDSEDAGVWAKEIKKIKETERKQRLDQAAVLRSNYDKKYNWEKQCGFLVRKMLGMVSGKKLII